MTPAFSTCQSGKDVPPRPILIPRAAAGSVPSDGRPRFPQIFRRQQSHRLRVHQAGGLSAAVTAWTEVATVPRRFLPSTPRRSVGPSLLLLTALALGQTPPPEEAAPALPPPPDRWPLMLALQGTYPGWLLDGNNLK